MKYYIIAGEASGDLHASNLMKELARLDDKAEFRCWGGDKMEAAGGELVRHYRDTAFMGFLEVAANLRKILGFISFCKKDILRYNPDVLILVDYPGFNLRIAGYAHKLGFKVHYYISPQVWAWKSSRVKKIRQVVDEMYVILPFEEAFYARYNYKVHFVGHPLLDAIGDIKDRSADHDAFVAAHGLENKPVIALLPGSRRQEIGKMLPVMLAVAGDFPDYQFVIGGAPAIPDEFYVECAGRHRVSVVRDIYALLYHASAAAVTSGTATLEAALLKTPEVVCYKGSAASYFIARRLVKVPYISLVNLVMDREVVKELIQDQFTVVNLKTELTRLLGDNARKTKLMSDYSELAEKLGGSGASARTAQMIHAALN